MKFALLGSDPESLQLAEAAVDQGHQIAWADDVPAADRIRCSWLPTTSSAEDWEDLVDSNTAEAVIIGRGLAAQDVRCRQVQELVKLGRPVLVCHPLSDSVITYFEIDLARTDGQAVLFHYNPLLEAREVTAKLSKWIREGHLELGAVEQIVANRAIARRDRPTVLWHFFRDVELLDRIAGPLNQLGAHGPGAETDDYSALAVQLSGTNLPPVRWLVEPAENETMLRVDLVFAGGRLQTVWRPDGGCLDAPGDNPAAATIRVFVQAVDQADGASSWPSALRAAELADTIEISLRRGRIIDVHRQQLTEQLAFKGTMSALGCGVLTVVIPLVLAVGLVAGSLGIPVARFLPHVLLGLLAAFLVLQLLPKLLLAPRDDVPGD